MLEGVVPIDPVTKVPLPIISILEESVHEDDQTMNDPSLEHNRFELPYHEYVGIFNELAHCFNALPNIFNEYYTSQKGGIHIEYFQTQGQ